jgi:GNAT superfamily N-acetyltransferase
MTATGSISTAVCSVRDRTARLLLEAYCAEMRDRLGNRFEAGALASSMSELSPPTGVFVVLRAGTEPVAAAGLRWLDSETAEIKRMYVDPARRGQGYGRRLLAALEAEALRADRHRIRLDTAAELVEARKLYQQAGYSPIADYNGNPCATHWFEKLLAPHRGG